MAEEAKRKQEEVRREEERRVQEKREEEKTGKRAGSTGKSPGKRGCESRDQKRSKRKTSTVQEEIKQTYSRERSFPYYR